MQRKRRAAWAVVCIWGLVLVGCAGGGVDPITDCTAGDSKGNRWTFSDVIPLSAEDAALMRCGQESADPSTCAVIACAQRW